MGAPKQKWTPEEEEALKAGVLKHGTGKWKNIQKDPEFFGTLAARSNIDLKDKWRNMSVSAGGQGSRGEKLKIPKVKTPPSETIQTPSSSALVAVDATEDAVMEPPTKTKSVPDGKTVTKTKSVPDGKTVPPRIMRSFQCTAKNGSRYITMILEVVSTMNEPNGSDISAIMRSIKEKQEVPPNFRRLLTSKLRRLVQQNKLVKTQNGYKIKEDITSTPTRTPAPKQKDVRLSKPQNTYSGNLEMIKQAAVVAAYKIVDAENKSYLASEAVKEAERVAKMAEDAEAMLQLAREICERCSRGEIVLMA